jgi:hypothetical protein
VAAHAIGLDQAVELTRTGDVWLFRGHSVADRAIQTATNAPVNHVGMAVTIDDLPPLMWHAELGRSLQDMWTGRVPARASSCTTCDPRYRCGASATGQRAFLRQLRLPPGTRDGPRGSGPPGRDGGGRPA